MVKAYLRYEHAAAFGVVVSSDSNIVYDATGKLLVAGALEQLMVWNPKQGRSVQALSPSSSSSSSSPPSTSPRPAVTSLCRMPSSSSRVAAGYGDGSLRLWDVVSGICEATFNGHKSAVTALRYNVTGSLLASGSKDTDIVLWDAVGEAGLYRLRAHRDQVTDLVFLEKSKKLVSCSKDTFLRVWDLDTQHCVQTVDGHRNEIWSVDVDPLERNLIIGFSDSELRVYMINEDSSREASEATERTQAKDDGFEKNRKWDVLSYFGDLKCQSNDRVATIRFNNTGSLFGCQVAGKVLEIYRVRDEAETLKQARRRMKRKRKKVLKAEGIKGIEDKISGEEEGKHENETALIVSDQFKLLQIIRVKTKICSFCFSPHQCKSNLIATVALSLGNNTLEVYELMGKSASQVYAIDLPGHRSDVRSLTLSQDNTLLMSTSHNSLKIWNPVTGSSLHTVESGYGLCGIFAPGNRYAVIGTKGGTLEIYDIGACECLKVVEAHSGSIWSITPMPDGRGFITGSADHDVKFWEYELDRKKSTEAKTLSVMNVRTLNMAEDVLAVRLSPDAKYLAVALLDSTIKVFFTDSLKFFLSLYGHKLPVLCMDISSDGALLASGSADKNLKFWGMDFGDCHRSLFAHADSVMAVQFVRNTHYIFSVGKDKLVKYWDADKFELLLTLEGHHSEIWCLAVSSLGDFFVTGSHDRSIRRWERTDEPFFVEEEREKRLEALFDSGLDDATDGKHASGEEIPEEGALSMAGRQTLGTVNAADSIIEALDLGDMESERIHQHKENKNVSEFQPNVMMLGLTPQAYVLRAISNVRSSDLEQALLALPFTDALKLMSYLKEWMLDDNQVELVCRVAILLLRLHHNQLTATATSRPVLTALYEVLQPGVKKLKDTLGFNLAAMGHLQHLLAARSDAPFKDSSKKLAEVRAALSKKLDKRPDQVQTLRKKRRRPRDAA